MNTGRRHTLVALVLCCVSLAASAATRTTANYTLVTDSLDQGGGAGFSASYANRAALETVVGVSGATIPDATARFIYHGFMPQLDPPLFAVADVAVSVAADSVLCSPGELVTYSGSVTNLSPEGAPGVVLTLSMPTNAAFLLAAAGQGGATLTNNTVRFTVGTLPSGAVVPYSLQVLATSTGPAPVTATVTVEAVDRNPVNNTAAAETLSALTIYSTGSAMGGWFNAANWTPAIVPTSNHIAVVDGEIMDLYTADATVAGLVLTGGRIAGAHRLTVTKLAVWSGGELQSYLTLVIPPGGLLRVTNGYAVNLRTGSGIENRGTVLLDSTALQGVYGAWVTNYGLFEVAGQRSFQRFEDTAFDFRNEAGAVFRRSAGAGTNRVVAAFHNEGLVENVSGVLDFGATFINGGWSLVNNGTLRAGGGSEILYTRAHNFRHGTAFEGPGTHRMLAASAGPNDGCLFEGEIHGDFTVAYGWMGGTFTNTGQVTWSGGDFRSGYTWTIAPGGVVTVTGAGERSLVYGYLLRNRGTLRLAGASLSGFGFGALENLGLLDLAGDYSVVNSVVLTNQAGGVLRKSAGTGRSALPASLILAGGTVDVWSGTLAFAGDYAPSPTSLLRVQVGGTTPGEQHGRVTVAGTAALNGTLMITTPPGFAPAASDTFQIVAAGTRSGVFATFDAASPGAGLAFRAEYGANGVLLRMAPGAPVLAASSVRFSHGEFEFELVGGAGGTYVIESAPGIGPGIPWQPVQTNVLGAVPVLFRDPAAGLAPARFYRAVLRP